MKIVDIEKYAPHYSEEKLTAKIAKVAKKLSIKVLYGILVLFYALNSPNISLKDKARIYGALGYFILPIDLIPDALPLAGYADDWAALLYVIKQVMEQITPETKHRAKSQLHEWFGDFDETQLPKEI